MDKEYLLIGEIVKPQGIRGEVKLKAESQDMSRYARLREVYLKEGNDRTLVKVEKGRASGDFAYLKLEGINDRNAAESLRGVRVYVDREHAIKLSPQEYFICDLIGLEAHTEDGERVGILRDVISPYKACDVYVFDTDRGEMMMPALKKAILSVDVKAGKMLLCRSVLDEIASYSDSDNEVRE